MLDDGRKIEIEEEEAFRLEVSRKLCTGNTRSKGSQIWAVLNSSFVLWLLSSVIVSGITATYAIYQQRQKDASRVEETRRKLDTEILSRIDQALAGLKITAHEVSSMDYGAREIYENVFNVLDNSYLASKPENSRDLSVIPEFRTRTFRSLVWELRSVVEQSEASELDAVLSVYEELADLASVDSPGAPNVAIEKSQGLLKRCVEVSRWKRQAHRTPNE